MTYTPRRYTYRNLQVWDRAQNMAVDVIKLTRRLPERDKAAVAISNQLIRAAGSVGANIAEGHGRMSRNMYRQYLVISRGSASEVGSWLDLLKRLDFIAADEEDKLQLEGDSLIGLITFKMRTLADAAKAKSSTRVREPASAYGIDEHELDEFED
jgi:four helix bundle protein